MTIFLIGVVAWMIAMLCFVVELIWEARRLREKLDNVLTLHVEGHAGAIRVVDIGEDKI